MTGLTEAEVRGLFPTTEHNPKVINLTMWVKLDKQHYRIRLDKDIASMGQYKLVRIN